MAFWALGAFDKVKNITEKLTLWKENDTQFKLLLRNSPVLEEAATLSANLSLLAEAGLEAAQYLHEHKKAGADWLKEKLVIATNARKQGGRCEIQVTDAIQKLIQRAAE